MTRWSEEEYQKFKTRQEKLAPLPRDLEYHDLAGADDSELQTCLQRARAGWRRNPGAQDAGTHTSGPPALSEKEVTKQIRSVLNLARIWHWKNWAGPLTSPKGISDILGVYQGRMLAIEVKNGRWRPPGACSKAYKHFKAQVDFIFQVNQNGGIGFFAQSADEVVEKLDLKGIIMPLWGGR